MEKLSEYELISIMLIEKQSVDDAIDVLDRYFAEKEVDLIHYINDQRFKRGDVYWDDSLDTDMIIRDPMDWEPAILHDMQAKINMVFACETHNIALLDDGSVEIVSSIFHDTLAKELVKNGINEKHLWVFSVSKIETIKRPLKIRNKSFPIIKKDNFWRPTGFTFGSCAYY